jgi:uncharacterized protein (TIGR02145 family)
MNKSNVFCSSPFYLGIGDILHILIIDDIGTPVEIELSGDNDNYAPSAPTATDATSITETGFTANWMFNENTTGYYLDVAEDIEFTSLIAGFDNYDAGNDISEAITGLTSAVFYYYRVRAYNDYGTSPNSNVITTTTTNVYGALYNWYAANYSTGGASIAPAGWHVPTTAEFDTLKNGLGGWEFAGGPLKETLFTYWNAPNTGADNSSGFSGRGAGERSFDGSYDGLKAFCFFHTSDIPSDYADYGLALFYDVGGAGVFSNLASIMKIMGGSIRPIKDNSTDPGTVTDYDGNVYNTVKIGTQVWFKENLKVTHYNDGTEINHIQYAPHWIADTTGAYVFYGETEA